MERLKSLVPDELKQAIAGGTCDTLPVTAAGLLQFFLPLPHFQQVINQLTDSETALCCKDESKSLDFKLKGNQCFSKGDFTQAISFYSQGLRYAAVSSEGKDSNLVATLYVNRASSFHKIGLFEECLRDCNRAIKLMPNYAKAWYRRGKVNESLKKYKIAISDLEVALNIEETISGINNIKKDLNILYSKKPDEITECRVENSSHSDESSHVMIKSITTPNKGRGLISPNNIPPSSLIHSETPIAAIVAKQYRETHCHYCFVKVPEDCIYCTSCTIPIYCSDDCQIQSIGEHKYECGGAHWSAVLPSYIVLAARVVSQKIENRILDLVHHYERLSPGDKLEMHIYAMVLSFCMEKFYDYKSDFSSVESFISELVILICKIKINSMAIIHVNSIDGDSNLQTTNVNQIRVGQAIYSTGSLFNHSCKPNSNIYFSSRTLLVCTTEFVPAWTPLEISYGPQVGEMDMKERQKILEDQYKFKCECLGCSNLNFADLVINSFSCPKSSCVGAILRDNISLESSLPSDESLDKVAHKLFQKSEISLQIHPGNCLNCNSNRDLDSANEKANVAKISMNRLLDSINKDEISKNMVLEAFEFLQKIKCINHRYSKAVAKAEDSLAEIFVKIGDFDHGLKHCKASIEILEKLYHPKHIAIGHELIKLATIQFSLCLNLDALNTILKVEEIFSLYYGSHVAQLFPYVNTLRDQYNNK